ncbi:TPA: hypothetical protein ACFCFD_002011, partial [Neisseria gonorrhoeae]
MTLKASGRVNLLTLSVLSLFCTPYAWGSDAYDPVKEAEIKNKFILEAAEDRNSHVWRGPCSVSFDCFGAFSYQPGSDTRPTNVGDTADFSFSDKPANGVFHYFSSGKTDQKSSEALYDEINITGKNYNSGILAVDNMPVVKKYITDNYRTDLKQAVKKQLQDLYKTRPEAWEENKKRVREEIIKQFGISEDVFNKLQQKMPQKINSLIEEQVLT